MSQQPYQHGPDMAPYAHQPQPHGGFPAGPAWGPAPTPPRRHRAATWIGAGITLAVVGVGVIVMNGGGDSSSGLEVTRQEFEQSGRTWPLTLDRGTVDCEQSVRLIFTAPNGTRYRLNGTAEARADLAPITDIWALRSDVDLRVSMDDLLTVAVAEC